MQRSLPFEYALQAKRGAFPPTQAALREPGLTKTCLTGKGCADESLSFVHFGCGQRPRCIATCEDVVFLTTFLVTPGPGSSMAQQVLIVA